MICAGDLDRPLGHHRDPDSGACEVRPVDLGVSVDVPESTLGHLRPVDNVWVGRRKYRMVIRAGRHRSRPSRLVVGDVTRDRRRQPGGDLLRRGNTVESVAAAAVCQRRRVRDRVIERVARAPDVHILIGMRLAVYNVTRSRDLQDHRHPGAVAPVGEEREAIATVRGGRRHRGRLRQRTGRSGQDRPKKQPQRQYDQDCRADQAGRRQTRSEKLLHTGGRMSCVCGQGPHPPPYVY
jgi:hypothetical protein